MLRALLGKLPHATGVWLESLSSLADETFPGRKGQQADPNTPASLYRSAPLPLAATALLGLMLSMALDLASTSRISSTWLAVMLGLTGLRLLLAVYRRQAAVSGRTGGLTRQYLLGVLANAALWATLPWLTFENLSLGARISTMLATIAVASAESRPLAARMPRNAALQAALLVLPGCLWLLDSSDAADTAISGMTIVLLLAVLSAIRVAHRSWQAAQAAADENHRLTLVEESQRQQIERLLKESADARHQMERAQQGLEARIDERTAALEGRSRELAAQAVTDSLTKLPNRKGINDHLTELLEPMREGAHTRELALLFLDLDDFKEVNDQFGHLAGDQVLSVVADRLRETMPRAGFAARWGGDEFIVVLPGLGKVEQIRIIAEQVRAALCLPIRLDKGVVRIGCSIGIAIAPEHGRTPEALVISADHAVYAAKSDGNERVRVFDIELAKKAGRQHQIAQGLPAALDLGQLEVVYQPIVSAETGLATHVESLTRWYHPKWGAVSPGEFIPVAEASGHIHTLGRWVLRQACLDAARWPGTNAPKVSVNVSALQVSSGRLVAQVREALSAAKLPASRLVIELTESLPMGGGGAVAKTLADLRDMGVKLAIDDFGTGYSSLSALMKTPLSLVKVDRSFTKDVPGEGELLIKATVDVARCFGLDVVAEGVETHAQRTRLIALGVGYMQGYLFGRPMPHQELIAWLALHDTTLEPFALQA